MVKQKSSTNKNTLRLFWRYMRQHKWWLAAVLILMPLNVLAESIIVPFYSAQALDLLAKGGAVLSDFYSIFAVIAVASIFNIVGWRALIYCLWRFEVYTMRDMHQSVFGYFMSQSHRFFVNRFAGSLVSQANKFVGAFERLIDTILWSFFSMIVTYIFTVIILWPRVPVIVIALLVISILYLLFIVLVKRREIPFNEAIAEAENRQTGQLADSITNIAAVKSYANEAHELQRYTKRTLDVQQSEFRLASLSLFNEIWTSSLGKALGLAALVGAVISVVNYGQPIGTVYLVMTYIGLILGKLWDIQFSFRNINRSFGDAAPMTKMLLEIPSEVIDDTGADSLSVTKGAVHFSNIDFGYPEQANNTLFSKFNLDVAPGEKIGLVGPSGGGKTTVTMLLLRFMDIHGGQILIDDQDISKVTQASLRDAIAYVPQDPTMFHRSIADNIRYGRLDASDEEVIKAAKQANAHEFIDKLPSGYKTLVGERGTKLSGGQRQRVAIARAIISNAPILVLDEATSALDSESEKLIQDALQKLMKNRTTLVVAHRLSTIQKMDRIIVLKDGHITEKGSHKELLAKKGHYATLWNHQSGGFLED